MDDRANLPGYRPTTVFRGPHHKENGATKKEEAVRGCVLRRTKAANQSRQPKPPIKPLTNAVNQRLNQAAIPIMSRGAYGPRPGDWTCPGCQANVFASKSECFKCQTPKPSSDESGGGGGGGPSLKLFVGKLPSGVSQDEARQLFEPFGACDVSAPIFGKGASPYLFVTYRDAEHGRAAIARLDKTAWGSSPSISVQASVGKGGGGHGGLSEEHLPRRDRTTAQQFHH